MLKIKSNPSWRLSTCGNHRRGNWSMGTIRRKTAALHSIFVRGRILTLPPERRSPTRQVLSIPRKRAGSEIGAPPWPPSRGQYQDAPFVRSMAAFAFQSRFENGTLSKSSSFSSSECPEKSEDEDENDDEEDCANLIFRLAFRISRFNSFPAFLPASPRTFTDAKKHEAGPVGRPHAR